MIATAALLVIVGGYPILTDASGLFWGETEWIRWFLLLCGIGVLLEEVLRTKKSTLMTIFTDR